jgi:hypothetical protein
MDFLKQPIFYVIVVVAVSIAAIWTYIGDKVKNKTEEAPTSQATQEEVKIYNLTNLTPGDFDSAVRDEYALAVDKANAYDPAFKLSSIEVTVDEKLNPSSINTRYIFSSPADKTNNWTITITAVSQNYLRALVPKEDYAGDLLLIDVSLWKYNYVTALQLAEQFGGLMWREQNTLTGVKLTLKNVEDKLLWIVEYSSSDNSKTIKLDANSGKVVNN